MNPIYATMKSEIATPRISSNELKNMFQETKKLLRENRTLNRYVFKDPILLNKRQRNIAIKLILGEHGSFAPLKGNENFKNLIIRFANYCANFGVDFRTLDIPKILLYAPYNFKDQPTDLYNYLESYAIRYQTLLYGFCVPIHLFESEQKWALPLINILYSFFENPRNYAFRSSVIGAKNIFITSFLSELDLTVLLKVVPRKILEFCTPKPLINAQSYRVDDG